MHRTLTAISTFSMAYVLLSVCFYTWKTGSLRHTDPDISSPGAAAEPDKTPATEEISDLEITSRGTTTAADKPAAAKEILNTYMQNGTFRYDLPTGSFAPDILIQKVPIDFKEATEAPQEAPPQVAAQTIYQTSVQESSGVIRERRKKEPLLSFRTYCNETASLAEREATYQRKLHVQPPAKRVETNPPKKILFWNPFFEQADYHVGLQDDLFRVCECPYSCNFTMDKNDLDTADAVIIHTFYLRDLKVQLPPRTRRDQIFTFYLMENPVVAWDGMLDHNYFDVFNLTMTYMDHPSTDIYIPAGDTRKRIPWVPYTPMDLQSIKMKSRPIAWIVSNCASFSERDAYVKELSNFIDVDIFGECGTLSCPLGLDWGYSCMKNLTKKYFFYLAAENTICDGYISEKVFRTMFFDMVPIVYGGGNYSKVLPRESFVDVRDYKSPEHLSKYLDYLIRNPEKYMEYFKWKEERMVVADDYHRARGFCKLCTILNDPLYPYKSKFDLLSYWNPNTLCKRGKEERRAMHLDSG